MKNLTLHDLKQISGGVVIPCPVVGQPYISPCSSAVINFLRYRSDMLSALLNQDSNAQSESAQLMNQYQQIAMNECSQEDLIHSGCVGPEIFLY